MLKFLKRKLSNEKGAMDNIIVSLLLIGISVLGIMAFSTWSIDKKNTLEMQTVMKIDKLFEDNAPAAGYSDERTFEDEADNNDDKIILED